MSVICLLYLRTTPCSFSALSQGGRHFSTPLTSGCTTAALSIGRRRWNTDRWETRLILLTFAAPRGISAVTGRPPWPSSCGQLSLWSQPWHSSPRPGAGSCHGVVAPDLWYCHILPWVLQPRNGTISCSSQLIPLLCDQLSVLNLLHWKYLKWSLFSYLDLTHTPPKENLCTTIQESSQ